MYSIRKRLFVSIVLAMTLLLMATALVLYFTIARQVERVYDTALLDKAQSMISLTEMEAESSIEFDFTDVDLMPEFGEIEEPQYYQVWHDAGDSEIRSPSLGQAALPRTGVGLGRHRFADLELADGRAGRLIEIDFLPHVETPEVVWDAAEIGDDEWEPDPPPEPTPVTLAFARERESLDRTLLAIGLIIVGVYTVVIGITAWLILRLVGSGLMPLSRFARRVSEIDESRLDQSLDQAGEQSSEIAPIRDQLNYLLERLNSAFEREKRFSSNVAHELRTPLSELKTLAEVGSMLSDDRQQLRQFFSDVGEISDQMEKIVVTLLELARSDAGLLHADPEDIRLAEYCEWIWGQAVNGRRHGKRLVKQIPGNLVIHMDREKLGMILTNLFINAVSYSPDNAEIRISAAIRGEHVVLEVSNTATDLRPEDIVHMKDRFWRKQKKPGDFGHSGLGLSLVDALARIMRLDVNLHLDQRQEFMVSISGIRPSVTG